MSNINVTADKGETTIAATLRERDSKKKRQQQQCHETLTTIDATHNASKQQRGS